jgi:phosphoribosylanthranilate isomerase
MIIKVCGMRDAQNIRDVASLDIDMMGFNFWPKSKRFVRMISSQAGILPDYSPERLDYAVNADGTRHYVFPKHIKRVGVFVDEMPQTIVTYVYNYSLDYIQLHGSELPVVIENLRRTLVPDIVKDIKFIKAFGISTAADLEQTKAYEGIADLFLFDYKTPEKGGSGKHFDWSVLDAYQGKTPFLLSGGIGPDDAEEIKNLHHPMFAGVDVNSRFETEPAVKDVEKLRAFVNALKQ